MFKVTTFYLLKQIFNILYIHFIIHPQLALLHNRLHCVLHSLGRVTVVLKQFPYHHTHFCPCAVALLPVYGVVFSELVGKFFCNSNKLLVFIEIFYRLRLGKGVVKSKFVSSQTEFFARFC